MKKYKQPSKAASPFAQKNRSIKQNAITTACLVLLHSTATQAYAQSVSEPSREVSVNAPVDNKLTVLPTVKVQANAEKDTNTSRYAPTVTNVGKTPQALRDIPQAITVIPKELIVDRNDDTLKGALRNVAGLTFNAGEGGRIGDNFNLRGFYTFGDVYLDGIRDVAQYNRETFNIEQVDILRGSAAMLFGRGQAGGVINQVSKSPLLDDLNQASVTVGQDNYKRFTSDFNYVVDEDKAFRLNAMYTEGGSTRDNVNTRRVGFAPSFAWGLGTRDEFSISHYYLDTHNVPDYGIPFFQTRPVDVPANRFFGTRSDYEDNTTNISTAAYKHRFSDTSTIKNTTRFAYYTRDLWAAQPQLRQQQPNCSLGPYSTALSVSDASCITRSIKSRGGEERTLTNQTDWNTTFNWLGMKHEALAGVELLREKAGRWSYALATGDVVPGTTLGNPDAAQALPSSYGNQSRLNPSDYRGNTIAVYAQDSVEFIPGWKALFGLRKDSLKASYSNGAQVDYSELSNRTGLMYQPDGQQSYYLSRSDSFNPTADLYQFTSASVVFPAERSRTIELGAKWDLFNGNLIFRTAVYRATKEWERNTDVESAAAGNTLLSRTRHTDGVEFELAGKLTPRWEVFSGLAFMKSEIDAVAGNLNPNLVGQRPRNTPKYSGNIWSTYKLEGPWRIGGGVIVVGDRLAYGTGGTAPITPNVAPAYQRWDAMLAYEQLKHSVKLNMLNLFDKRYYESLYENGGHVVPGTSRTAQLTLVYKF